MQDWSGTYASNLLLDISIISCFNYASTNFKVIFSGNSAVYVFAYAALLASNTPLTKLKPDFVVVCRKQLRQAGMLNRSN